MMETVLQGLTKVQCYIDDILVKETSKQEHLHNLKEVLKCLSEYGIRVKCEKCAFFKDMVEYLGYQISEGLHTTPKIEAIQATSAPRICKSCDPSLDCYTTMGNLSQT